MSLSFLKTSFSFRKTGQAIVEYILILTIAVVILGALILNFNKSIKDWGESIVGDGGYIACLMQTGKLSYADCSSLIAEVNPDLSLSTSNSTGSTSNSTGSTSNSTGSTSNSTGSSSNSTGSTSNSTGSTSNSTGSSSNSTGSTSNSTGSTSNSTSSSSSSSGGGGKSSASSSGSSSDASSSTGEGTYIPVNPYADSSMNESYDGSAKSARSSASQKKRKKRGFRKGLSASTNNNPGFAGRRFKAISSRGYMTEESRRKNRKIAVSRAGVKKQSGPKGTAKRAGFIKKEGLKKKEQEIKIEKWSFGNMFRIFLIICIIATILLIVGSQTAQVRKSMK